MLTEERHAFIIKKLTESDIVKSHDLMMELNCSESTIRRDLALLEESGELIRVHGGAKRNYHLDEELDIVEKSAKNIVQKSYCSISDFSSS